MKTEYIYCDANVFVAYFNAEASRVEILDTLFDTVQKHPAKNIITSVLTLTEVSHIAEEKQKSRTRDHALQRLDEFWNDTSLIEFVDFNEIIARQARTLIRDAINKKHALYPYDAIHLTSARYAGTTIFFTYDRKLTKFSDPPNFMVQEPFIDQPPLFPN